MPTVRREGKPLKKSGPSMNGEAAGKTVAKRAAAAARPARAPRTAKKRRKAVAR